MPESTQNMSLQDSDGSVETPDRSLGSLSFTATGEQLDDIQVNLDRMYLESPAPSSFIQTSGDGPSSFSGVGLTSFLRSRQPLQPISVNAVTQLQPQPSDPFEQDNFDRLSLIDIDEVPDIVEEDNWLIDVPASLPTNFSEDDRSFLDTNLLNKRFFLLNYVTRVINEEIYAETQHQAPISANSNLVNESAGSGATFKVIRPNSKSQSTKGPIRSIAGATSSNSGVYKMNRVLTSPISEDFTSTNPAADLSTECNPDKNFSDANKFYQSGVGMVPPRLDERKMKGISSGSLTFRRAPMQRQSNVSFNGPTSSSSGGGGDHELGMEQHNPQTDESRFATGNYLHLGSRTIKLSHPGATFQRRTSSGSYSSPNDRDDFIPDNVSPVASVPSGRMFPVGALNGVRSNTDSNGCSNDIDDFDSEQLYFNDGADLQREIDTRTYTRPKKTRMSLGTPNRQLNTTMSLSPARSTNLDSNQEQVLNTTINLSNHQSPIFGTPNRVLNTTIDLSPERSILVTNGVGTPNKLNTTIGLPSDKSHSSGEPGSPSSNLNETFVTANGDSPSETARRVTRNLSYVIQREDEESPNNNSSPLHSNASSRPDLNNTYFYETEGEVGVARGSQNTSMEDLNSRVASQIRSLGCSTISRGRISDHGSARGNLDESRLVARTSSTDTYSVAHSSESPTSSGLSSPMDTQSYDDIQTSEAVRRSMPNLAVIRSATTMRSSLAFPQAGGGQLRKNHYISDSRLSRLGVNDRPRLSVLPPESTHTSAYTRTLRPNEMGKPRGGTERNISTPASLNRISSVAGPTASRVHSATTLAPSTSGTRNYRLESSQSKHQGSVGNVRSTGLAPPRFSANTVSTTGSGIRPPRPTSGSTLQPAPIRTSIPGIPVPTLRTQSRIPGPGQLRFSRPSSRMGIAAKPATSQKGPMDDWRDGCY